MKKHTVKQVTLIIVISIFLSLLPFEISLHETEFIPIISPKTTVAESVYEEPVIVSVDLDSKELDNGTELTMTVKAKSDTPLNWINRSFTEPYGSIYGGGHGTSDFELINSNLYEYQATDIVSPYAPSGEYYYDNISVSNERMLQSDDWPEKVSINIDQDSDPQPPVIEKVELEQEVVENGTKLTVRLEATSNSPLNWINRSFEGPHGNIYGGGHGTRDFTEISSGRYEYSWSDIISAYAPSGEYSYLNISVENEGMKTSEKWTDDLTTTINNEIEPEKWEKREPALDVAPDKTWTVEFNQPLDMETIRQQNIFVTDRNGNIIPMFYFQKEQNVDMDIHIMPVTDYLPGEEYTLWIRDIKSKNGQVLEKHVKQPFVIQQ